MTADTLTIVVSAIGIVLTLGTSTFVGAAWMVRRIDAVDEKLSTRIDAVAADVTDLKISVARLEGPSRHLLTPGGGDTVASDTLTIVISAIGIVLTLGTSTFVGAAWMVRRIDAVDEKLSTRIDAVDEKLSTRIDAVAADVSDLKISVARLEGPPRHLLTAGR